MNAESPSSSLFWQWTVSLRNAVFLPAEQTDCWPRICLHFPLVCVSTLFLSLQGCSSCCSSWSPLPPAWHRRLPPPAALAGILYFPSSPFCECFFLCNASLPFGFTCIPFLLCKFFTYLCFSSHWTIAFRREGTKSFLSCGAGDPGWSQHWTTPWAMLSLL